MENWKNKIKEQFDSRKNIRISHMHDSTQMFYKKYSFKIKFMWFTRNIALQIRSTVPNISHLELGGSQSILYAKDLDTVIEVLDKFSKFMDNSNSFSSHTLSPLMHTLSPRIEISGVRNTFVSATNEMLDNHQLNIGNQLYFQKYRYRVVVSNWWRFQNHVETAATVEQVLDETISQLGAVKAFCRYRRVVGLYFQEQDLQIVKNNLAMLLLSTEGVSISITRRVTKKEIEMREKAIIEGLTAA